MPQSHLYKHHSYLTYLDGWWKQDLFLCLTELDRRDECSLTNTPGERSPRIQLGRLPTAMTLATGTRVHALITYEAIACSKELNYLKIHPGVTSIPPSRDLPKKEEEEKKEKRKTEQKKKRKKKNRMAGPGSTTASNLPSKIGVCYLTSPCCSEVTQLLLHDAHIQKPR